MRPNAAPLSSTTDSGTSSIVNDSLPRCSSTVIRLPALPRTHSGKLAELAVRDAIHGREVQNSESLVRPEVLDAFRDLPELR